MASFPKSLKDAAKSGDMDALHAVLRRSNQVYHGPLPNQQWFMQFVDIAVANFRPELHARLQRPQAGMSEQYKAHMKITFICFECLYKMTIALEKLSTTSVEQAVAAKVEKYWASHFRIHLHKIMEFALDDLHPAIDESLSSETAFYCAISILDTVQLLGASHLLRSKADPFVVEASARLFCLYLDRYSHRPAQKSSPAASFSAILCGGSSGLTNPTNEHAITSSIFSKHTHLVSHLVAYIRGYTRETISEDRAEEFNNIVEVIQPMLIQSDELYNIFISTKSGLMDVLMRLWSLHLSKGRVISPAFSKLSDDMRQQSACNCIILIIIMASQSDAIQLRSIIRQHFFDLMLHTFNEFRRFSLADPFTKVLQRLSRNFLMHYSVLSVTLHSLRKINADNLDAHLVERRPIFPETNEFRQAWLLLCQSSRSRETTLAQFRAYIREPKNMLCGSEKVWQSFLTLTTMRLNIVQCPGNTNERPGRCGGCSVVFYCSRKCQESAWEHHKTLCSSKSVNVPYRVRFLITAHREYMDNLRFVNTRDHFFMIYQVNYDFQERFDLDLSDSNQLAYIVCSYEEGFPPTFSLVRDDKAPLEHLSIISSTTRAELVPLLVLVGNGAHVDGGQVARVVVQVPRKRFLKNFKNRANMPKHYMWIEERVRIISRVWA